MAHKDLIKRAAYQKLYRANHLERRKEQNREIYLRNHEARLAYQREHYKSHPAYHAKYRKKYYKENRMNLLLQKKEYHQRKQVEILEKKKKYYLDNTDLVKEKVSKYTRYKRKIDVQWKLRFSLCGRVRQALKGSWKSAPAVALVGCSIPDLKKHLERKFLPGMTWDNWTRIDLHEKAWNIDHIRPCASFDLTDPAQQRGCFHYTNLQPLWAKDNIVKGKRLTFL